MRYGAIIIIIIHSPAQALTQSKDNWVAQTLQNSSRIVIAKQSNEEKRKTQSRGN